MKLRNFWLICAVGVSPACGDFNHSSPRKSSEGGSAVQGSSGQEVEEASASSPDDATSLAFGVNSKKEAGVVWHSGWDALVDGKGVEVGQLPGNGATPKTIMATKSKKTGGVRLLDYWLRDTGWTTMFGHALSRYNNKNWRTDGVRWDTPTSWVPNMANGKPSGGNMTLRTQFGSEIPSYWRGAKPYAAQTDWIFNINYSNGGIMEIFDRQHFGFNSDGSVKVSYNEVVARSYYEALYWAPHYAYPVATGNYFFEGPARFVGTDKTSFDGYSKVEVINRYDSFTVPPARNLSKDCPAAEFKDVIAVKHYQYWWDPVAKKSRGDYMVIYMARNIGWIYILLNDSVEINASGQVIKGSKHVLHMSPQGYVSQAGGWKRICAHEFRDLYRNK